MLSATLQNRYRLEAEMGRGGMGVVYRAHDVLLDRPVAVKVLTGSRLGAEGRNRLLREAQAAARLNHPNIVSVYDVGVSPAGSADTSPASPGSGLSETDGTAPYIVMELVEGQTLYERWPLPLDAILEVAAQVCAALDHAHAHGIVHRDLKLENVLVMDAPEGLRVKLTDFGLARSLASRLTNEGTILGTVFYVAPELALGQPFDGRADLYALGVLLYELTTGRLPFTGDEPLAVVSQHLHAPVVPPRAHNEGIPPPLDALIVRLLAKRPQDRPASAREVQLVLESLRGAAPGRPGGSEAAGLLAAYAVTPSLNVLDRIVRGRMVGRERELAETAALWRRAAQGEGHTLLISGEPGIGKTRLARELLALAEVAGATVLTSECYSEGGAPYAPLAQALQAAFASAMALNGDDPAGLRGLPQLVLADLVTVAPSLGAYFAELAPNPPLDPQSEQQRLFDSVSAAFTALTDQAPVLLLVDDVHWADSGTLVLLRHLARRARRQRLLIVLTYREVELDQSGFLQDVLVDLNRERLATRLKLTRLSREQTRDLLAVMFEEEILPEFLEGIYRETEGNPFFVEEVCKALIEQGKLYFADGRWHRPVMDEIDIPQSVRLAIQARLSKLPAAAQDALRLAAVLGREFDFDTLRLAGEMDEETLIDALEVAERAQLIAESRQAGQVTFAFGHALIPATLRESVSGLRRQRLHRRAASAIAALRPDDYEALAGHYEQAGDAPQMRRYYALAGDRALAVYANAEAERCYRAALERCDLEAERARLLAGLGEALFRGSQYAEAVEVWKDAIDLYRQLADRDQVARLYGRAARAAWYTDDWARGLALAREGLAAVGREPETPGLAALLHETGRACYFNKLTEEAEALCQQALDMAERLGLVDVQAETLTTLGILPPHPSEAGLAALTRAIELAEPAHLLATAARAHFNLGGQLQGLGRPQEARQHFKQAADLARRMGLLSWQIDYLSILAYIAFNQGELDAAQAAMQEIRQLVGLLPQASRLAQVPRLFDALMLRYHGSLSEAREVLDHSLVELRAQGELKPMHEFQGVLAEILIELKEFEEAERLLVEAISAREKKEHEDNVFLACLLCNAHAGAGRFEEARQCLAQAYRDAQSPPGAYNRAALLWAESFLAVAERRWADAFASFEAAEEVLSELGMRWHRARAFWHRAEAHLRRGEPGDLERARELLVASRAAFEELNVGGYAGLVQARLDELRN